jgi:HlyD family secretion protein
MSFDPEIDDIISKYPSWTLRWGILVIISLVILALSLSWMIKYPEVIQAEVVLSTDSVPTRVVSKSAGQLNYFVKANQYVSEGTVLGLIKNPARYADIIAIMNSMLKSDSVILYGNFQLGELQRDFVTWRSALKEYNEFVKFDVLNQRINGLRKQLTNYQNLQNANLKTLYLNIEDLKIDSIRYRRDSLLHVQHVIADADLQVSKVKLISKELEVESSMSKIESGRIQLQQLYNSILDLTLEKDTEKRRLSETLRSSISNFISSVAIWESKYLLVAPIDGNVFFINPFSRNQFINLGEEVFYLASNTINNKINGRMSVPFINSGKVKDGQTVLIKLYDFPFKEYGMVVGKVEKVSSISIKNTYVVEVCLPEGFRSTYKKEITFKNKMAGSGEIVVDNTRLLSRLFYNFRYIFQKMEN